MTFQPRMQNRIEGFSVIGGLRRRHWNGITSDLWDVECAAYAGGYYVARDPRLVRKPIQPAEVSGHTEFITADGALRTLPQYLPDPDPHWAGLDGFYAARLVRQAP